VSLRDGDVVGRDVEAGAEARAEARRAAREGRDATAADGAAAPPAQPTVVACETTGLKPDVLEAGELMELLEFGKKKRATAATEVNGTSSRSHAVCQLYVTRTRGNGGPTSRGVITMVDCAGSERSKDSMYHSKERQMESVAINQSLYALKECVRAKRARATLESNGDAAAAARVHVPYRQSTLTRLLKPSLTSRGASLVVLACAAPTATDAEHTAETLKTVCALTAGASADASNAMRVVTDDVVPKTNENTGPVAPKRWPHASVLLFVERAKGGALKGAAPAIRADPSLTGAKLVKMSQVVIANKLCGRDPALAKLLFDCLRLEMTRASKADDARRKSNVRRDGGYGGPGAF